MKKEYIVVTQYGYAIGIVLDILSIEVNQRVKDGFIPIGGISVVIEDAFVIATQAMISE